MTVYFKKKSRFTPRIRIKEIILINFCLVNIFAVRKNMEFR